MGLRVNAAIAAVLVAASVAGAGAQPRARATLRPSLPAIDSRITLVVNGQTLARTPAPRILAGRVYVPAVKTYAALGVATQRSGGDLIIKTPGRQNVLHPADLRLIDGVTYVPLRFLADSLGAQVSYETHGARVEIVSSLVGRNPGLEQRAGGGMQIVGTASAVDLNSSPETLTVERGGSARTVTVPGDAQIALQDVAARINVPAALSDVHVGDAVSVLLRRDGRVGSIVARYASHAGAVAAVSPDLFVLADGFMVSPDRATTITLNGAPATLADLRVGDSVTVRLNPDTNEKRQIVAVRAGLDGAAASPAPGTTAITDFTVSGKSALRAGDGFTVTLQGTPGGRATYDIGQFVTGLPMTEAPAGTYTAHYTVPAGVNFGQTQVFGHLIVAGAEARAAATRLLAISTTPPQIVDVAPGGGATVDNNRPSIFATYRSLTNVGINAASASIAVNGADMTDAATRTDGFITVVPAAPLGDGPVRVVVRVSDRAGNAQSRAWTFTVRTR